MLRSLLPESLYLPISRLPKQSLNEIRLRIGKPIVVNMLGENMYLTTEGLSSKKDNALICKTSYVEYILAQASNNSLYTINDQLIRGYISVKGGIRIGVAGDVVTSEGNIRTIKNIASLNIRIPHDVKNCSLNAYLYLVKNGEVQNTLVVSPPGAGKTTFLRDFAVQIGKREKNLNLLIVDERCEISGCGMEGGLDVGDSTDIYTNCTKKYAFENGIRSMKPDVILTDEINLDSDLEAIENAVTSGVKVVASIHAEDIQDLKNKKAFSHLLNSGLFTRFVVLSCDSGPGTLRGIYNEHLNCIYC